MKQLAIIPRDQRDIVAELEDCRERLENSGIQVYGTLCGRGYGILWAEGSAFSVLANAGFQVAPVTRTRWAQIRTRTVSVKHLPSTSVS
jgi:hypothetical protein